MTGDAARSIMNLPGPAAPVAKADGSEYLYFYDADGSEIDSAYLDECGRLWLDGDDSGNWFYPSAE